MPHSTDRNLLTGILAWQLGLVGCDQLLTAMDAWILESEQPLEIILFRRGVLTQQKMDWLRKIVDQHLEFHGNDLRSSLRSLNASRELRTGLESLDDPHLQATVAQLVWSDDSSGVIDVGPPVAPADGIPDLGPAQRFQVVRPHARGGLGEVFVAKDLELNREVALKAIQGQYCDDEVSLSRFLLEAEVTGGLEHPGIVPVYGLGKNADGRPFYAMRFIRGESLKETIERLHARGPVDYSSLEFRQLLGRFVDVCQAIEYAHSRGVLHRDLKPANIMLGKFGETLVLDWGLAKPAGMSSHPSVADEAAWQYASELEATRAGVIIGTPGFMSPEQAAGQVVLMGPTTDIYSLGATLYQMLTAQGPIGAHRSTTLNPQSNSPKLTVVEVLRRVKRGEYLPPRDVNPGIPAPLAAICVKAMALQPGDRYPSAADLAADIERYLADEPVSAFVEPLTIRARRWMKWHQTLVGSTAAAAVVTAIALGIFGAVVKGKNSSLAAANAAIEKQSEQILQQFETLTSARQDAQRSADEARAVLKFFENRVLAAARPESQDGGLGVKVTVREAIDAADPLIPEAFANQPLVEASLRNTLGVTYSYLRLDQRAIAEHSRARELRAAHLGPEHPSTLESMNNLAVAFQESGQVAAALPLFEQTLQATQSRLGAADPETLTALGNLAMAYKLAGKLDLALPLLEQTLERRQTQLGPDHPQTLTSMNNLANAYLDAGQLDQDIPLFEEALERRRAKLGPEHPHTLMSMNGLAMAYKHAGRLDRAVPLLEQALQLLKTRLGPEHPVTLTSMNNLAMVYSETGQSKLALALLRETLDLRQAHLGTRHPDTLVSLTNLASVNYVAGNLDQARLLFQQTLPLLSDQFGPDHPLTLTAMNNLAKTYQSQSRLDQALPLFGQALELTRNRFGSEHRETLVAMTNLALAAVAAGQFERALPLLQESLDLQTARHGADHPDSIAAQYNLARALQAAGQAERSLPLFEQALARQRAQLGAEHPHTLTLMNNLALAYQSAGRVESSVPLLEQTLQIRQTHSGATHPDTLASMDNLARTYLVIGKPDQALPLFEQYVHGHLPQLKRESPAFAYVLSNTSLELLKYQQFAAAEPYLRECLEIRQRLLPDDWTTSNTQSMLGGALAGQKKFAEAEPLLLAGWTGLRDRARQVPPNGKIRILESYQRLVDCYTAWGKPAEAEHWQQELDRSRSTLGDTPPPRG
ncbi:MAG: tetratricopeptide repeat protein [Planctomycetes bacterium]|nr:tetratricopeptide repeat protein [Planctomycetota bacterium]